MDLAASRTPRAGNAFDKYGSESPVVRRVMGGFLRSLDELLAAAGPAGSVLDAGCGEGIITRTWARRRRGTRVVGLDRDDPLLHPHWAATAEPNLSWRTGDVHALPFEDGAFDLVASIEVLEQVADPDRALAELVRVARRAVLVSVPREPLWRVLNVASGRYVRALGNSPGTVHHFSRGAFAELVGRHAHVQEVRSPPPWTLVLARP